MPLGAQTGFIVAETFMAKRRLVGGRRQIRMPSVFRGRGFREIRFDAEIEEDKRWAGDIISVFENLKETTPFEMSRASVKEMGRSQVIQGIENLAQVLELLRSEGADTITVILKKPHFHPGSTSWAPSVQEIRINARVNDVYFSAILEMNFPPKITHQLLFPPLTIKQRIVRWLLK
jgi:hypothetical protein